MSLDRYLLRRPEDFGRNGRITWIEKTADLLRLNRVFLRRPPFQIEAPENQIVSPADSKVETISKVSAEGRVEEKSVLGRKRNVFLQDLVKDDSLAGLFHGGDYVKLYLAPWYLHYLIFPVSGKPLGYEYRAGWAFPLLFMKSGDVLNERLCVSIETDWGIPILLVMIGSWFVNGIHHAFETGKRYERGRDLGYFKIGSSVVMAFPADTVRFLVRVGDRLRIGAPFAQVL